MDGVAAETAWSIAQVTARARELVDAGFPRLWVRGEVSGLKAYRSGHWYFSLRDPQAQVRCVMWRSDNQGMPRPPDDGLEVFALAQPTLWEEKGEFRLTIRQLIATTADGAFELALARAKAALARDGLLDPARRRPLPPYPMHIAVVTSPDAAALKDIRAVLERRWPLARVTVVPTRVQGETAERELVRALGRVNRLPVDVVIVGRGGGSREDLWAFNRESVARAIAAVRVPVVSAVGHETDVTLADLVADLRAPTPSAAAEAVVPDVRAVRAVVDGLARRLGAGLAGRVTIGQQRLARTGDRLHAALERGLDRARTRLGAAGAQLDALSPLRVVGRGYAVARDPAGRILSGVTQFPAGAPFRLTLRDGTVGAQSTGTAE